MNYNNNRNLSRSNNNNRRPNQTKSAARPQVRRRKKKPGISVFGYRLAVFLVFFIIIGGISGGIFIYSLTRITPPPDIIYTVYYTQLKDGREEQSKFNITLARGLGFANNTHYFPITAVMDQLDLTLAGDDSEFSFIRLKYNEHIRLISGSATAYINGAAHYLSSPPVTDGLGGVYVPLAFMESLFENFTAVFDGENPQAAIAIEIGVSSGPCVNTQKAAPLAPVKESPEFGSAPAVFISDISGYEIYFNPPAKTRDEYIILINGVNPLAQLDYVPPDLTDLVDTRKDGRATQQLRFYPAKALEAFLAEARANGMNNITVTSAYRSYEFQNQLFRDEAARLRPTYGDDAESVAATSVARPGHSEHQSGLGVDMHTINTGAAQEFGNTPEGRWLAENAHYFGFILRYPADKTEITGVKYEPWHFRYVGRQHAARMYELGLCLEEYLAR